MKFLLYSILSLPMVFQQIQGFVVVSTTPTNTLTTPQHNSNSLHYQTPTPTRSESSLLSKNSSLFHRNTNTALSMALVQACMKVNDLVYSRKVVLFGVSDDPHTNRIHDLFTQANVQFTSVNLDQLTSDEYPNLGPDMMEAITHMTGRSQVPCIYIDGKFVGGHDHIIAMNLDGYLGKLLQDIGAIPYDRMRELKKQWRQPAILNLTGNSKTPTLT